ncbi:hypothetical protein V1281_007753 [Nitrobacteraceae bacterium AZCC 2161]|jgi:hypothetical protein
MGNNDADEKLFSRLRRIAMSIKTASPLDNRRRLLALEADLRSVRDGLDQRCRLLTQKMNEAGAQLNAVSAYARCASLRRDPSQPSN